MNGHKFVPQQFYQIMLCAYCSEFLLNATGYQCEDCRYTCHKKCYEKVVTKCISKSASGTVRISIPCSWILLLNVYLTGGRRGQDQAQNPAQVRNPHEYRCKLVLPLRLHATPRTQEFQEMQRMRDHMSFDVHALCPRFLRYEHGDGESDPQGHGAHQELTIEQTSSYHQAGPCPITRTAWIWFRTGDGVLPA